MKIGGLVKTPVTGDKKANASSKAATKPAFKGSDVAKEKSKPAGNKDYGVKSKDNAGPADSSSAAVKGRNKGNGSVRKFKTGGNVKKYQTGGNVLADLANAQALNRVKNARKYLGPAQQSQAVNQGVFNAPAPAVPTPAPAPALPQAPGGTSPAGAVPTQKRGGKVKKGC
jgi:hypothetical protein